MSSSGYPRADTPRDTEIFRLEQQGVKVHHAFNQYNINLSTLLLVAARYYSSQSLMATFMISVFSLGLGLQYRRENYSKPAEHVKLDKDLAVDNEDWRPAYLRQHRQSVCVKGQYVAHILGSSLLIMLHVLVAIVAILCDSASFMIYRTQCAAAERWIQLLKQNMKVRKSVVAEARDGLDVNEHEMDDLTDTLLDEPAIACTRFSNGKSHFAHYKLRESG
ncbi:hypothetical protein AC579_9206 [Pseudocercospora musae]|uniref:Uncharacterized protein n=1 Tax=Pseudocercospora musae TaxID=113226 RepID=A0A139I055_9PEZI|nr:hypothetical protein AC579_9206 [Pseudocercospora musae]KXT08105.1 hypothetical protein AC579_9206 [Pseudocercospora musae]